MSSASTNFSCWFPWCWPCWRATIIQGVTGYAITQLVSKAGQRLIAELRAKVQAHIGRLPVAYYDANKTGTLVARIMTDVDGIRNLLGTGLIEFAGGILQPRAGARVSAAPQLRC